MIYGGGEWVWESIGTVGWKNKLGCGSNRRCRESRTKMPIAEVDPNFYTEFSRCDCFYPTTRVRSAIHLAMWLLSLIWIFFFFKNVKWSERERECVKIWRILLDHSILPHQFFRYIYFFRKLFLYSSIFNYYLETKYSLTNSQKKKILNYYLYFIWIFFYYI